MSATIATIPEGSWTIDPVHTSVGFEVKHLGVSTFRGAFTGVEGAVEVATDGAIRAIDGAVDLRTATTADPALAGHLAGPDFFDVDRNPQATFRSTAVTADGDALRIAGELTLRGITHDVELRGELEGVGVDPYGNDRLGISARGGIDRSRWGITWNAPLANGALAVAERVTLVLAVEAIRKAA